MKTNEKKLSGDLIFTPLPLIYDEGGSLDVKAGLFPSMINDVIGILMSNERGVRLKDEPKSNYEKAHAGIKVEIEKTGLLLGFPRDFKGDAECLFNDKEAINDTIQMLQDFGRDDVEPLKDGSYRLSEVPDGKDCITLDVNLKNGKVGHCFKMNHTNVRLVFPL